MLLNIKCYILFAELIHGMVVLNIDSDLVQYTIVIDWPNFTIGLFDSIEQKFIGTLIIVW